MLRTAPVLLALFVALALAPASAPAALVTVAFEGVVTENRSEPDNLPGGEVPYQFTPGERFSLALTYDLSTPDSDPDPARGEYEFGGSVALSTSNGFWLEDADAGVRESVGLGATDRVSLFVFAGSQAFRLAFEAPGGTLSSDAMLTVADFLRFPAGAFEYDGIIMGDGGQGFLGTLDAGDVAPVPEPSTLAALGVGLGLLGLIRARRRRRA